MFEDAQTQMWNAAALSADAVSTNGYDLGADAVSGATRRDPSIGEPLCAVLTVGTAAKVSGTTETYEFQVIQADDGALTTNVEILAKYPFSNAQAAALLTAGAIIVLPVPPHSVTRRYIGLQFDGSNTPTITVTAWFTLQSMTQATRNYGTLIQVL